MIFPLIVKFLPRPVKDDDLPIAGTDYRSSAEESNITALLLSKHRK